MSSPSRCSMGRPVLPPQAERTLVRHVMCVDTCSADGATGSTALAPTTRALRVRDATAPGALVALCSLTPRLLADLTPASSAAIAVAAVAAAAQDDLDATTRAQVKAGGLVHAHPGTTEVLDGLVPARHTAAAPPSSARCRARCGGQASRRERPLPCPPSSASTALYRGMPTPPSDRTDGVSAGITADVEPAAPPPAPAWPPCRAARQAHTRINTQPVQQPLIASSCLAPKPPPHQRIVSDPALGADARDNSSPDFKTLRKKMAGLVVPLQDNVRSNNAFIMRIGPLVIVEFSGYSNGRATWRGSSIHSWCCGRRRPICAGRRVPADP